jgi:hypothetical protein
VTLGCRGSKESFLQQRKRNYEVELTFPLALFLILGFGNVDLFLILGMVLNI